MAAAARYAMTATVTHPIAPAAAVVVGCWNNTLSVCLQANLCRTTSEQPTFLLPTAFEPGNALVSTWPLLREEVLRVEPSVAAPWPGPEPAWRRWPFSVSEPDKPLLADATLEGVEARATERSGSLLSDVEEEPSSSLLRLLLRRLRGDCRAEAASNSLILKARRIRS